MRGSQHTQSHSPIALGIIPAYAGPTPAPAYISRTSGDHPRVCGAHSMTSPLANASVGSSPRMRGSRKLDNGVSATEGSSPRMRGSPEHGRLQSGHAGIIPAYAGLTQSNRCSKTTAWDHPRACGAHGAVSGAGEPPVGSSPRMRDSHITKRLVAILRGSSPRMRGSLLLIVFLDFFLGIIPAHAGLTRSHIDMVAPSRDHPRACGAHIKQGIILAAGLGSSPRMRGSRSGVAKRK